MMIDILIIIHHEPKAALDIKVDIEPSQALLLSRQTQHLTVLVESVHLHRLLPCVASDSMLDNEGIKRDASKLCRDSRSTATLWILISARIGHVHPSEYNNARSTRSANRPRSVAYRA